MRRSGNPVEPVAKEVSAQYGRGPDGTKEAGDKFGNLDNGNVLLLEGHNYLTLLNSSITDLDEQVNKAPTVPSFRLISQTSLWHDTPQNAWMVAAA
jgi:hypothetical protein